MDSSKASHSRRPAVTSVVAAFVGLASALAAQSLMVGCEEGEHPRDRAARLQAAEDAKKAQAETEANRLRPSESKPTAHGGSQSSLGKARDSALRIQDKALERDKALGDLADQVQRGGG